MSEEKKGFFSRLVAGLTKTRNNIVSGIDSIFKGFSKKKELFESFFSFCTFFLFLFSNFA